MKKIIRYRTLFPAYLLVLGVFLAAGLFTDRAVTTFSRADPQNERICFVIDAGHGGEDGGATSCTGVLESQVNLEISLRLNDLMHLLGYDTVMVRQTDRSIYTKGTSLSEKKISDLKQRVKIVNETPNAVLLSIHQNHFSDSRYSGAQVFYAKTAGSDVLAKTMQDALVLHLNPGSKRRAKAAEGVYLMQHIEKPGALVECGFLSNPREEAFLRNPMYQKKLCMVVASVCSSCVPKICLEKS